MTTSIDDLLRSIGLERYVGLFVDNEIDLDTLRVLTDQDLQELGLPFGPRKRLLNSMQTMTSARHAADTGSPGTRERRPLTVLFCDMVDFTVLASTLDPEVLESVIRAYEDLCAACIARYDGFVYQRLGDGVIAFFGYPMAHEHEAERAVRTSLDIIAELERLDVPEVGRLHARVGIASGTVLVSPADGGATGETMNLAARLQTVAAVDTVAVSGLVRRLAGDVFEFEDLGERELKGIARPMQVFRVLGLADSSGPGDFEPAREQAPLIGRRRELDVLLESWEDSRSGNGRLVTICGEPGIGKSRLMGALRDVIDADRGGTAVLQCSPYHVNSPYHPIVATLGRAVHLGRDPAPDEGALDRLEQLVTATYWRPPPLVPLVAAMLGIPFEHRHGPLTMTPRAQKDATIDALVDLLESMASVEGGALFVEDAHWADPSTLEVLDRVADRIHDMPLLAVITFRPEFSRRWGDGPGVTHLELVRMSAQESGAIVGQLTSGRPLPEHLLEQILDKTDGVPLFVEELTKSMLESGHLVDVGGRYAYAGGSDGFAVPETLRDSLMARLDRLQSAKEVAQIGATIGREFHFEQLAAVSGLTEERLLDHLDRIVASELMTRRGALPDAVFTFKHALVREAAYDSLLVSRRRELHALIAANLEQNWPLTPPELVARHYTTAGAAEAAVPHWRAAGDAALHRFAIHEAVAHFRAGLDALGHLPTSTDRDRVELELRSQMAPALIAACGWAAPEVSELLEPAIGIARSLRHRESYLPVLNGLWVHHMSAGQHVASLKWAGEMLDEGERAADDDLRVCAHRSLMTSYFWMGRFAEAREHGDRIRQIYDPVRHVHIAELTNNDPRTVDGVYRSQYLWMLGFPDQAREESDAKDEHARRRNHPFDLCFALTVGALAFDYRGEPDELLRRVDEAERVGREHAVPLMSEMMAQVVKGIALLRADRVGESIDQLRTSLSRLASTGHRAWLPYVRAVLAEAVALGGDLDTALTMIDESLALIEAQDERAHLPEALRLKGWLLDAAGRTGDAETILSAAVAQARAQHALSWELRAATTLADHLAAAHRRAEALAALEPVHARLTEGFDTRDVRRASALLVDLRR